MIRVFALLTLAAAGPAAAAPDAAAIVRLFDSARAGSGGSETVVRLAGTAGGGAAEKRYRVLDDGRDASLVEFLDPLQRGTKVLATGTDLWFFAPRTRRAIKVPPLQRLFGEASYGDIARLRLAADYAPAGPPAAVTDGGEPALKLELRASSAAATYTRIDLTVRAGDLAPLRAAYFVASGKQLRTVEFVAAEVRGQTLRNDHWRLYAPETPQKRTEVFVETARSRALPPALFTRRGLEEGGS